MLFNSFSLILPQLFLSVNESEASLTVSTRIVAPPFMIRDFSASLHPLWLVHDMAATVVIAARMFPRVFIMSYLYFMVFSSTRGHHRKDGITDWIISFILQS